MQNTLTIKQKSNLQRDYSFEIPTYELICQNKTCGYKETVMLLPERCPACNSNNIDYKHKKNDK